MSFSESRFAEMSLRCPWRNVPAAPEGPCGHSEAVSLKWRMRLMEIAEPSSPPKADCFRMTIDQLIEARAKHITALVHACCMAAWGEACHELELTQQKIHRDATALLGKRFIKQSIYYFGPGYDESLARLSRSLTTKGVVQSPHA